MNRQITSYILIAFGLLLVAGCRQAKYVAAENLLLKKNKVKFVNINEDGEKELEGSYPILDAGEMYGLIRPAPNRKLKLFFYNRIDTTKHDAQVEVKEEKYRLKNEKRQLKEDRINQERIEKARVDGDSLYRRKVIKKKPIKLGWREWIVTNMGQAPVMLDTQFVNGELNGTYFIDKKLHLITEADTLEHRHKVDSIQVDKMKEQLGIYLKKKGFYFGQVSDTIIFKKRQKAIVQYEVLPGKPYSIRNINLDTVSITGSYVQAYKEYLEDEGSLLYPGNLLDQDVLDAERDRFSQYGRNQAAFFGFNKNYVGFAVDTTVGNRLADITMFIKPKFVEDPKDTTGEKKIEIRHFVYRVKNVTFYLHNPDPYSFKDFGRYKERCDSLVAIGQLDSLTPQYLDFRGRYPLLDTLIIYAKGTFIFNEEPFINPDLLDKQNFLEIDRPKDGKNKFYKEYYVERSYRTMTSLGIFGNISPKVEVDPNATLSPYVMVSYDLMPLKKQSFLFDPSVSNTNGILGIQGAASYTNKNLFRGAEELRISLIGGMESQPLILGRDETGNKVTGFKLNTFEWGPKVTLSFPKIVPLSKKIQESISKRAYPKTVFDLAVNFQKRSEFKRSLIEGGYSWNFKTGKTQDFNIKISEISYVNLTKEDFFREKLEQLNDPFVLNSYTDHLTTISTVSWHYNNLNAAVKRDGKKTRLEKNQHDLTFSGSMSGKGLTPLIFAGLNALDVSLVDQDTNGLKRFFGLPFTEFWKLEGQYIGSFAINKKHKIVGRAITGVGIATGNSPSLPYEQAYFGGGSNDIRAFEARTMAPGSVKTYADTNSTVTQIGDLKLEANLEWRFEMTSLLEGALFVDAGNIWNLKKDTVSALDPSVLKRTSYKEIALGLGVGVRIDLDFLILRVDMSLALHNPHLPQGERWILSPKTTYKSDLYFEPNPESEGQFLEYEQPHALRFNFGIGYPF